MKKKKKKKEEKGLADGRFKKGADRLLILIMIWPVLLSVHPFRADLKAGTEVQVGSWLVHVCGNRVPESQV